MATRDDYQRVHFTDGGTHLRTTMESPEADRSPTTMDQDITLTNRADGCHTRIAYPSDLEVTLFGINVPVNTGFMWLATTNEQFATELHSANPTEVTRYRHYHSIEDGIIDVEIYNVPGSIETEVVFPIHGFWIPPEQRQALHATSGRHISASK